jgi:hypothetical protein
VTHKALLPGASVLERTIARVRSRANNRLWRLLAARIKPHQKARLDALLVVPEGGRQSLMDRLRSGSTLQSTAELARAIERLDDVRQLAAGLPRTDRLPKTRVLALARFAAEGDESIFPGIAAALARDRLDRADHVRGGDQIGAPGSLLGAHAEGSGDALFDDRPRLGRIEPDRATDQMVGVQIAEDDICVGQGGLGAAAVVAYRTRSSARTLRPDLHCTAGINPDKGPAPSAYLCKVDGRNLQRIARTRQQARADHDPAADRVFERVAQRAVLDDRGLGRGPAHVDWDRGTPRGAAPPTPPGIQVRTTAVRLG